MRLGLLMVLAGSIALAQRPAGGALGSGSRGSALGSHGGALAPGAYRNAFPRPVVSHPTHNRAVIVPYPVYYGYGYGAGALYAAPQAQYGPGAEDTAYPDGQPPVMIVNQAFQPPTGNPVFRDYSNFPSRETAPQQPPDDTPSYYLIAMKDHRIVTAIAYWVLDDTLGYITLEEDKKQVPLSEVDTDFSKQLNRERRIDFKLPSK